MSRGAYFIATVVVLGLRLCTFSSTTLANSSLTLAEGNPVGRVQRVVLSTYSTATDLEPFWMLLIKELDTYLADIYAMVKIDKSDFKVVDSKSTKAVISRNVCLAVMISSCYLSAQGKL
jgi:hypothetical protein